MTSLAPPPSLLSARPAQQVEAANAVREVLKRRAGEAGALLPILHEVQDALGYVPAEQVPTIAEALNLSHAEACQSMGADALMAHAELRLGCSTHGAKKDGAFTLEPVYCLGLCASSPALMLDGVLHARMTPRAFDALIAEVTEPTGMTA